MKRASLFCVIVALFSIVAFSCKNGSTNKNVEEKISADVVANPNTANGNADTSSLPKFLFEEEIHDFGRVIQGEKVSYSFKFKNAGKSDLVITDAKGSCGCTIADYPKKPVKSGESGTIDVKFSTEGRKGFQSKTVTIIANTQPNTKVLTIKAMVQVPEEE